MSLRPRIYEFLRFCVVGGIGFLVDSAVTVALTLLLRTADLDIALIARIAGIFLALQVTYRLHARFTFRADTPRDFHHWAKFMQYNLLGAGVNYGVFFLTRLLILRYLNTHQSLIDMLLWMDEPAALAASIIECALIAGTIAGLLFNYWANRCFVFKMKVAR